MRILFRTAAGLAVAGMVVAVGARTADAQGAKPLTIEQHAATMKGIAQSMGSTMKALKGGDAATAATGAEALSTAFSTVETFYTQRNKPEAIKLAQTARMGAQEAAAALKAGDTAKAQAALGNTQATCATCHKMFREQDPETKAYRFNAASGITAP